MSLGISIEDLIEKLCCRSFFADFTIRNPKYYKLGGLEKEAADVLVVFDQTLLAIQVKSKRIDPASTNPVESARLSKVIDKSIRQFRALSEALNCSTFISFVNGRGIEVEFDKNSIKEIILLVVFVPIWAEGSPQPQQLRFSLTCYPEGPIPIHLFSLDQFSLLLTLLDTLPDFLNFLAVRWGLHSEKVVPSGTDPIDEWALVTFEKKKLSEILEKKTFTELSGLFDRHGASIRRLERMEKPSYFIDQLIERLFSSVGTDLPVESSLKLLEKPNSLESYGWMIRHLAKLNRQERARLAEFLMNRVMACRKQEIAFRGFKFGEESETAYVVLASRSHREGRRIELTNLARGMGLKLEARTVVGMAVAHDWPNSAECDVAVVDVSNMKVDTDLITLTEKCFRKARMDKG